MARNARVLLGAAGCRRCGQAQQEGRVVDPTFHGRQKTAAATTAVALANPCLRLCRRHGSGKRRGRDSQGQPARGGCARRVAALT